MAASLQRSVPDPELEYSMQHYDLGLSLDHSGIHECERGCVGEGACRCMQARVCAGHAGEGAGG